MGRPPETRDFQGPPRASGAGGKLCRVGCTQQKEKIAKKEVQEKKTELHGKQREGKKGPAGQLFQAINSEGGRFRK